MTKTKFVTKLSLCALAAALPLALVGLVPSAVPAAHADYELQHQAAVSITNSSFNSINTVNARDDVSGWKRKWDNTGATTMIIDTGSAFGEYSNNTYFLNKTNPEEGSIIPGKKGADNKILMINSASKSPSSSDYVAKEVSEGYVSNDISLSANSYYEFQVSVKSASFDDASEFGSIYFKDSNDKAIEGLSVVNINAPDWQTYYFYIATGSQAESVNIELWLGSESKPSTGVIFFDEVYGKQLSENAFYEDLASREKESGAFVRKSEKNDRNIINTDDINFNFEKDNSQAPNTLVDWSVEDQNEKGNYEVFELNEANFNRITSLAYPGADFSANNTKALALWAENGYVSLKSKPVEIKALGLYKITALVKTAELEGNFTLTARETESINDNFTYLKKAGYKPMSKTTANLTSNGTNAFINNYYELTMYVQGHDRYNSEIELLLNLGSSDNFAKGGVIVDDITVELVSTADFSTEGNSLVLQTAPQASATIANGQFNNAVFNDNSFSFPAKAADWTVKQSDSAFVKENGIISTYDKYFKQYSSLDWAKGLANPGISTDDVNNILMMYNSQADYQSISSQAFTLAAGSYNTLSFKYKTPDTHINVKLVDEDGVVILNRKNISSADWSTFECTIFAGEASSSVTLTIELGNEKDPASGYSFFDSVVLNSADKDVFENAAIKVDLSGFMLNLDPEGTISSNITTPNAFTGTNEIGSGRGGIIIGAGNDVYKYVNADNDELSIDDGSLKNNVLVIETDSEATYKMTSLFTISTEADKYYELKFRLLTSLPAYFGEHIHDGKESAETFGVKIGLDGYKLVEGLTSNDGWKEFTILFKGSAGNNKFVASLVSHCSDTAGAMFLTDISWRESSAESYSAASERDAFNKTLFTTAVSETTETPDDNTTPNTPAPTIGQTLWIAIPSLIMGLVVIFAVLAFALRNIKIKKVEKKRKEDYDRSQSLNNDIITNEAKAMQKAELAKANEEIAKLENEIAELDSLNKETVAKSRKEGRVTKEIEKEFKAFAQKRAKIQKTLDEYKEHKAYVESADYVLDAQKKITADKQKQQANAKKSK